MAFHGMKSATETCVAKVLVVIDDPMQVLDISSLPGEQSGPESEVAMVRHLGTNAG